MRAAVGRLFRDAGRRRRAEETRAAEGRRPHVARRQKLTRAILTLQAEGSYAKARAILDRYSVIRPPMQRALAHLGDAPVGIEPHFLLAQR